MLKPSHSLGIHFIFKPGAEHRIPLAAAKSINSIAEQSSAMFSLALKALNVREDHMHMLVGAAPEIDTAAFIEMVQREISSVVKALGGPFRSFDWDPSVHITLLPPWHLDILAAFVRDQDTYHATHTLEQELQEIFQPNGYESVLLDDFDDEDNYELPRTTMDPKRFVN